MLAVVGLFGAAMLPAQTGGGPGTPNFNIGINGWSPNESFLATTNTSDTNSEFSAGQTGVCLSDDCDPLINFNVGGDATSVGSTFGFSADGEGGGSFNFINTGPAITNVLITTTITSAQQNEVFTCSSNEFSFCGFKDPDATLEIFFSDPIVPGGIPSSAPEPSSYALLLIGCGVLVAAHRVRSRRLTA